MRGFHDKPVIYEVNTCIWLNELSAKYGRAVTLDTVPAREWDYFAGFSIIGLADGCLEAKSGGPQNVGLRSGLDQ